MDTRPRRVGGGVVRLPAGFRDTWNEAIRGEFTKGDAGNLEAAQECAAAAGQAAAVHNTRRACIAGQLGKRSVVLFCFQFRTESGVFFDCFLFALVALEP